MIAQEISFSNHPQTIKVGKGRQAVVVTQHNSNGNSTPLAQTNINLLSLIAQWNLKDVFHLIKNLLWIRLMIYGAFDSTRICKSERCWHVSVCCAVSNKNSISKAFSIRIFHPRIINQNHSHEIFTNKLGLFASRRREHQMGDSFVAIFRSKSIRRMHTKEKRSIKAKSCKHHLSMSSIFTLVKGDERRKKICFE